MHILSKSKALYFIQDQAGVQYTHERCRGDSICVILVRILASNLSFADT